MTINVSKNMLLSKLRVAAKAIKSSRETIYSSFLIEIENDKNIKITASDETGRIQTSAECVISDFEEMKFLVDASTLMNGLKELPEQPIRIVVQEKVVVVNYSNGKFEIARHDAAIYPGISAFEEDPVMIDGPTLAKGFRSVAKFAATDGTLRPIMATVNMASRDGMISFAATDGHHLSVYSAPSGDIGFFDLNVPARYAKLVYEMIPSDGEVSMQMSSNSARFVVDDCEITYRLIEGRYPNYRSVIPANPGMSVRVNCADLISAVSRVSVFSDDTTSLIILETGGNCLTLTAEDVSYSQKSRETMMLGSLHEPLRIGFRSAFLVEILKTMQSHSEACDIRFSGPTSAAVFNPDLPVSSDEEITAILMPLKVDN